MCRFAFESRLAMDQGLQYRAGESGLVNYRSGETRLVVGNSESLNPEFTNLIVEELWGTTDDTVGRLQDDLH